MKYTLRHTTIYDYESPVSHGRHVIRKRPRPLGFQSVLDASVTVEPEPVWHETDVDYFGNLVDLVEVIEPHDRLVVTARSVVDVGPRPLDVAMPLFRGSWEAARDRIRSDKTLFDIREMSMISPLVPPSPRMKEMAADIFEPGRPLLDGVLELNHRIFEDFVYDPKFSDIATPLERVLRERRGVCQDFAHVAVGCLRSLGLAARYVSGYLETMPPPGKPRLVGADASHAWASVYIPDHGWVGFDPTNDVLPSHRHVVVGWGRDFGDVSPLRGVVLGGGSHTVTVGVDVMPGTEPPGAVSEAV